MRSPLSYPPAPANEAQRLETLRRYDILDTEAEPAFDDLVALAARLLDMPMALVTLIDQDRQWFKAQLGIGGSETERNDSFCAHALGKPDLLVVQDATTDERFKENPYVLGDPNVRFYAGAPLVAPDGSGLGALCVLDRVPRKLTEDQELTLKVLGRQVMNQLELRRLLARSRKERQDLLGILNVVPAAIIVADAPDGRITYQNQAVHELLGRELHDPVELRRFWRDTQVRRQSGELVPPSEWPAMRALAGAEVVAENLTLELPNGRALPILIGAAPMRDGDGHIIGAVVGFQDVSQLHEVARLKSEFVSTVSHELRTPLTSIRGSLQLLLADDEALPSEDGRELVGVALKSSERLVRIINDILDIAKIEAGQLPMSVKHVDARALLQTAVDAVGGLAQEKRLTIDVIVDDTLPSLLLDQDRMVQSLVNLLSNAIKFSPAGTRVTIRAAQERQDDVVLSVSDAGPGIPEDQLAKVFEKFHQVGGANRQGTGLGLSITKAIVEQHGGRITVASTYGVGTTFSIILPVEHKRPAE
jgi:signal transduction histidine kinase